MNDGMKIYGSRLVILFRTPVSRFLHHNGPIILVLYTKLRLVGIGARVRAPVGNEGFGMLDIWM